MVDQIRNFLESKEIMGTKMKIGHEMTFYGFLVKTGLVTQ